MAAIIAQRINEVLKDEGLEEQYGNKGCADALTALKIALQTHRKHSLNSWVVFVDLVKAFDTVSHPLMLVVLKNYGFPPLLIDTIKRLYKTFSLGVNKGDEMSLIDYLISVHQDDNLAPVLFSLVFQAAMHTFDVVSADKFTATEFKFFPDQKNGNPAGRLTGQRPAKGTPVSFWRSIYVGDGAFIFSSWEDASTISDLLHSHLERFGLEMHVRAEGSKSKTEVVFFPGRILLQKSDNTKKYVLCQRNVYHVH